MALKGLRNMVGELFVRIRGDNTDLKAKLHESEQATQASAQKHGQAVEEFQKKATRLQGIVTGLFGVIGTGVAVFNALAEAVRYTSTTFGDGAKQAEKFLNTLSNSSDAVSSLDQIQARIQEVEAELAFERENLFAPLLGRSQSTVEQELDRLRASAESRRRQIRAQQEREANEQAERETTALENQLRLKRLSGIEQIRERERQAIESLEELRGNIDDDQFRRRYNAIAVLHSIEAEEFRRTEQAKRDAEAERARAEEQRIKERADREAAASAAAAAALERSFSQAADNLEQRLRQALNLDRLVIASERTRDILELLVRQGKGRG